MDKPLAVLLLRIAGAPDKPSRSYADKLFTNEGRGTRNLVDYFDEMSHGRIDLGKSVVFGWMDYGHTVKDLTDEWTKARDEKKKELLKAGLTDPEAESKAQGHANGFKRNKIVEWARTAAADEDVDLTPFHGLVCVFNQPVDYFGSPGETVINWEPKGPPLSVDLTGVAHEVGHNLGLGHSRREGSGDEYGDRWDIMSAYDGVYLDKTGTLKPPGSPYLTFGPGLNAVNMELAGWLDPARLYTGTGSSLLLRPLHRRDLPGWLAARIQIGYSTLSLEFRVKDRWDKKIPAPCILLHQRATHLEDGSPCSELIVANPDAAGGPRADLRQGESYEIGDPLNPFGFYARITVVKIDTTTMEAHLGIRIRERRQIEPHGTLYGAVASDGGGLVWTPGRGFVKVPPRSPLLAILQSLAEYEILQTIDGDRRGQRLEALRLERLTAMRDQLSSIIPARQARPVPAPISTLRGRR